MDKIEELRKKLINTPGMTVENVENINQLIKEVAKECMREIVANEEFNGRGKNGWWTIRETFDLENDITSETQEILLPINREINEKNQKAFHEAINNYDVEGIKEGLRNFVQFNKDGRSFLLDLAIMNQIESLRFFAEDDMVNRHDYYKKEVNFEKMKGELFVEAYHYGSKNVLEYLIHYHHAETTPEAMEKLSREAYCVNEDEVRFKQEILDLIKKKHLNFFLNLELPNKSSKINNKI